MIDLQKAFYTVNHTIMSDKPAAVGCDDGSVKWSDSYLSKISESIDIKGKLLMAYPMQGSYGENHQKC